MDDVTFAAMQRYYSTQEIVELTMQAAYYSASSQISRTLNITAVGRVSESGPNCAARASVIGQVAAAPPRASMGAKVLGQA
jgi:hypothetical protein